MNSFVTLWLCLLGLNIVYSFKTVESMGYDPSNYDNVLGGADYSGIRPFVDRILGSDGMDDGISDNLEEVVYLFEGDIQLDRNKRIGDSYRWPIRTVTYEISPEFTSEEVIRIWIAMGELMFKTCVRFRQREDETDYVFIQKGNAGYGCFSYVGFKGGRQIINLSPKCVRRHGTVVHELIHTIGLFHEQSLPDRDDYVTVVWKNIKPGKQHYFSKYERNIVTTFDAPYDYGSVMHYPATAFSIDGSPTIIPHDPKAIIGKRDGVSRIDAYKINLMYGCA